MPQTPSQPPSSTRSSSGPSRPGAGAGRPPDPGTDAAIRKAAIDLIIEVGYDRLTMEAIARRAKAGKGALYRRWPSKAPLVIDAIIDWRGPRPPELPDTGSLLGDIDAAIALSPTTPSSAEMGAVLIGVVSAAARDPALQDALETNLAGPAIHMMQSLADHAVARGEVVEGRDLSVVGEMMAGLMILRLMRGMPPDRDYVRRILCGVVYPLITGKSHPSSDAAT
jgi:AcrR family transcriptional regulator